MGGGADVPSLAYALGVVEAHARRLGARGNLPIRREIVRESTVVSSVALSPREVETYVHKLVVHVSLPQLLFGRRGHRCCSLVLRLRLFLVLFFSPLLCSSPASFNFTPSEEPAWCGRETHEDRARGIHREREREMCGEKNSVSDCTFETRDTPKASSRARVIAPFKTESPLSPRPYVRVVSFFFFFFFSRVCAPCARGGVFSLFLLRRWKIFSRVPRTK